MSRQTSETLTNLGGWDRFWFSPASIAWSALIRGLLCMTAMLYFASSWSDAAYWYTNGGPFSAERVSTFLRTAGLEDAAAWIVSPLFLAKSAWIYQLYLLLGIALSLMVALGRGGRLAPWALWLLLVGWANRAMILAGLTETLLSLGLFASAIAPPASARGVFSRETKPSLHWSAGFSQRLLATQVTVVLIATFATMLGGRVWFNGLGAYALAAPARDRTIDWTNSALATGNVHEALTHLMILALPLALLMVWIEKTHRIGRVILLIWCATIAVLGSLWLYGLTLAIMVLAVRPIECKDSSNGMDRQTIERA